MNLTGSWNIFPKNILPINQDHVIGKIIPYLDNGVAAQVMRPQEKIVLNAKTSHLVTVGFLFLRGTRSTYISYEEFSKTYKSMGLRGSDEGGNFYFLVGYGDPNYYEIAKIDGKDLTIHSKAGLNGLPGDIAATSRILPISPNKLWLESYFFGPSYFDGAKWHTSSEDNLGGGFPPL